RDIEVARLVDFHSIERVLTGRTRHIEKDFAIVNRAIWLHLITHHNLLFLVPVTDVEIFLVWGKSDAVGTGKIFCDELQISVLHRKDATERQLLARIVKELRQTERRIGKVECPVAAINKIIRAIETLALEFICKDDKLAVALQADDAAVAVLINR